MPKVVVYVRAEDARAIETATLKPVEEWVRAQIALDIDRWKESQVELREPELFPSS
jgi:hypothetical protein